MEPRLSGPNQQLLKQMVFLLVLVNAQCTWCTEHEYTVGSFGFREKRRFLVFAIQDKLVILDH